MSIEVNIAIAGDTTSNGLIAMLSEQEFAPVVGTTIYLPKDIVARPDQMGYYRVMGVVLHYAIGCVVANVLVKPTPNPYAAASHAIPSNQQPVQARWFDSAVPEPEEWGIARCLPAIGGAMEWERWDNYDETWVICEAPDLWSPLPAAEAMISVKGVA